MLVGALADDTFEGREAGSRGGRAAGLYIVGELKKTGAPAAGLKGSYYQAFGGGYSNILASVEGSDPELKKQWIVVRPTTTTSVTARVRIAMARLGRFTTAPTTMPAASPVC